MQGPPLPVWKRRITDVDGDGIEDNVKLNHD